MLLRGGPLDGHDVDLPFSVNGEVGVAYVDDDGVGVALYRVDGKFKKVESYETHRDGMERQIDYIFGASDLEGAKAKHPSSWTPDDEHEWIDEGVGNIIGIVTCAFALVGTMYLLWHIARWAMRIGAM